VRLHGGTIGLESRQGEGSTFRVSVPFGTDHLAPDRIAPERNLLPTTGGASAFVEEALRWLPGEDDADTGLGGALRAETALGAFRDRSPGDRRSLVLVADDNADMRDYVRRLLIGQYEVIIAANGESALALARAQRPDLILTDVMMPGPLDGFGVLREVRADAVLRDVPVIMLSARAGEEARIEGLAATADDYLAKPFSARELMARVTTHLEMARLRREAAEQERVLRAQAERAEARVHEILETITDGFYALDAESSFTYVNAAAEVFLRRPRQELLGRRMWELYPDLLGGHLEREFRRAVAEDVVVSFETWYAPLNGWFEIRGYPGPEGTLNVFFRDVTENKRAAEAVLKSNEALRRSNEDLERFAYAASHDLQEPLRMVTTYTQLLERRYRDQLDAQAHQYIRFAVDGAARMQQLIQALLEYGLVAGGIEASQQWADAEAALKKTIANLDQAIRDKGASVTFDRLPSVRLPEVQVLQVFQNLIGNALKYCRPGTPPRIHISATCEGGLCRFSVSDNGVGVPEQYRESIFTVFKRLHGQDVPGTGIGLSVCRRIIERAGGRIWVESEPEKGSTFWFTVPASEAREAAG
jgi:PAS domain S-box-containing protein